LATFDTNRTAVLAAVGVGPFMFDVSVTGSRGALSLRDLNSVMHIDATDFRRELGTYTTVNKWDPKTAETQHQTLNPTVEFLQAVALGNTSFGNADLAIDVARLSAAIYRSIASGTPVRVE
jgi:predicted dehydrogenase